MATVLETEAVVPMCSEKIRSATQPVCPLCGGEGGFVYQGLSDRAFDAPGSWNLRSCENSQCGILWLDPMPLEEDIWKAYRSYYTHSEMESGEVRSDIFRRMFRRYMAFVKASYLEKKYEYGSAEKNWLYPPARWAASLMPWRRAEWDMSVMYLPHRPGGKLLELGCGGGDLLSSFSAHGWEAEGLDVDPKAIENGKRKGLNVRLGKIEDLRYPANHFDAIVMVHVIEHIHDPRRLFEECRRILKPGGQLSFVTPNCGSFLHRVFGRAWFPLEPPRHLHIFSVDAITKLLREAGFETAHAFTTVRDADGLVAASRSIQRTGRFRMGSAQPRRIRVVARILQICEAALMTFVGSLGEELTGIARK